MELEFNIEKEYIGEELIFYTKPKKGDNKICLLKYFKKCSELYLIN